MKRGIKAIIFDVGGVLALVKKPIKTKEGVKISGVHTNIAKKLKITIDQYLDAIDTAYAQSIEGNISCEKTIKIISKNLKISEKKMKKIYANAYKNHFKQNKELFEQAFKLQKQGYKISVLSDQWCLSKIALMPRKLYEKFDTVVVSCDIGIRKPSIKIYKLFLKKLKFKPKETLFIDNQKWNIEPAKKLGMNTILFKDNKQLFKDSKWKNLFK